MHEAIGGVMVGVLTGMVAGLSAAPLAETMAVLAGVALGVVFYAGLWCTVSRAATFRRPASSMLASLLLRMGVTLVGFYLVAHGGLARLLLCLLGFVLARAAVTWLTRLPPSASGAVRMATKASHAP